MQRDVVVAEEGQNSESRGFKERISGSGARHRHTLGSSSGAL